jgi:hypothetical protein
MAKKKYNRFKQGKYTPEDTSKYKGTYPIIFRSSWEYQLMRFLDTSPNIVEWGSESFVVKYRDITRNNSIHRYYTDFTCISLDKDKNKQKYVIEVKPFAETKAPTNGPRKKESTYKSQCITYARNQCKWKAAKEAAAKRGWKFIILTENELFGKNKK